MNGNQLYATWVEVDLGAITNNVRCIHQQVHGEVMAIVKANAYGHGTIAVARAALRGGATWLGVARIEEALELRQAGFTCPILALGYIPPGRFDEAITADISLTVWEVEQFQQVSAAAQRVGKNARLHLKLDTGMSRLGVQPEEALACARVLAGVANVEFEGLFTHFARADERDSASTDLQEGLLREVLQALEATALRPRWVHAANSAACLTRPSTHLDMVRLGIAMYGLHPSVECPLRGNFRPALSWKAALSQVKVLPAGRGLSYGHEYVTRTPERIGTIALGYADGFRRTRGNQVLVGGKRVPVVGRVCMDQILVQLDAVPDARSGEEAVLIGFQGDEHIAAEEVARRWGTINYEVTSGISARVPRLYTSRISLF